MEFSTSQYDLISGDQGVRKLVDRFYDLMDEREDVKVLRDLHAKSLRISRDKLYMFLSGWLGGPQLYVEKYGHPRLRARHLPFKITNEERDQWMSCMNQALEEQIEDQLLLSTLKQSLFKVADFMRNAEDAS
ncbi:MAG: Hemoglobin-like protein HbO [uncultured Thiotrichaceae bacterium]|uniref:Hemoglobin-like protein HbO n=1 Tax=uncultured Thiotrichaceae bacterium TaxID=298394 RepID=A0A6S6U408_9GAMM|nr:MAG: Hemoglobin-like protein HbO [uncultured Thiotrichaceae bacterium]